MKRVVIIGGGVAGIAAAVRVAEAGWAPVVLETRPKLGGRATSFKDPRTGLTFDNCQHVVMGCCSNILDLYRRLDVLDRIEWHPETWWANPPRRPERLKATGLPAPLHFGPSFLRLRFLRVDDKIAIGQAMSAMIRMGLGGREDWRDRSFEEFLDQTSQPPGARKLFWEPAVVGACNLPCRKVAANHALQVFQEGFLSGGWHATVGLATCNLRALMEPAPSGIMFADEIRLSGLELFAKHGISEGVPMCVELVDPDRWGMGNRIERCLAALEAYGPAARPQIPRLQALQDDLVERLWNPEKLAKIDIPDLIRRIGNAPGDMTLRSLESFAPAPDGGVEDP